jgi:hypothetical protein
MPPSISSKGLATHGHGRELGKVDGQDGAQRNRHQQGDDGGRQGSREQGDDAEMGVVEKWRPLPVGQEVEQRDGTEEEDRFPDQNRHDGDRREYRNQCGQQQQALDAAFSEVARRLIARTPTLWSAGGLIQVVMNVSKACCPSVGPSVIWRSNRPGFGRANCAGGRRAFQSCASRFINCSMVRPTSFCPPKTVPSFFLARCSRLPV